MGYICTFVSVGSVGIGSGSGGFGIVGGGFVGDGGGVVIDGALDLLQHGGALLGLDVFPGVGAEGDGFGEFGLGDAGGDVGGALDYCSVLLLVGFFALNRTSGLFVSGEGIEDIMTVGELDLPGRKRANAWSRLFSPRSLRMALFWLRICL